MTDQQPKGWIATLIVALLMVGIVGSGFVAEGAVADEAAHPVNVGNVVVIPADGWEFAGRSDDGLTILLSKGSGSLAIEVVSDAVPLSTTQADALHAKRKEWLDTGTVTASDPEPVTIGSHQGFRFDYSGTFDDVPTPVEGTVTGTPVGGTYVLFDGWAGEGQYSLVSEDVDTMIASSVAR